MTLILYLFISRNRSLKKIKNETDEILLAHKNIGFPEIEKTIQLKIMTTGDLTPIAELIPAYRNRDAPLKLLKHYITISKKELAEHLKESGFIEKQKIENAPGAKHDGIWLQGNRIIEQEKGYVHRSWDVKNEDQAAEIYCDLLWQKIKSNY
ncbi:hypothetical protein NE848_04230 [Gramella jeungdoensis]|uniref:Uncharacterized protein n=1 Tax=Gramella jeungdoensis TaxID=708091 RepID=A0ABT0Z085_9FLAO|nr:hypothetical protein [Gramella jeungdoensis]MCM8568572.1 hypothetical protein [Gramella jeungdoensis]